MNSGSRLSLNAWLRWGCSEKARQMRLMLLWLSPVAWARERVDQCVAACGWLSRVRASTRSTATSLKRRGVPGRGPSSKPSRRRRTKRCRHLQTVAPVTCTRRATSVLLRPSAHSSRMRARRARAWAVLGRRDPPNNRCRPAGIRVRGESGRPRAMQFLLLISDAGRAITYATNIRLGTLGTYLGIRHAGKLVAMAGERMKVPGWTEVSAVCTHPDHTGHGYARMLMAEVMRRIRSRGETPFLHVREDNVRAIELYRRLGFNAPLRLHFAVLRQDVSV